MSLRYVFWGFILLLTFDVLHSAGYSKQDKMCLHKQLILVPVKIYSKCNAMVKKSDADESPAVRISSKENLKDGNYMLLMVDPDAYPNPNVAYLHWMKSGIPSRELRLGIKGTIEDDMHYEGPNPPDGTHRYQFLLYPQFRNPVVLIPDILVGSRLIDMSEFEKKNNVVAIMAFQYFTSKEEPVKHSASSNLNNWGNDCLIKLLIIYFGLLSL